MALIQQPQKTFSSYRPKGWARGPGRCDYAETSPLATPIPSSPQGGSEGPGNSAPISQAQGVRELPSGCIPQLPTGKRRGPKGPGWTRGQREEPKTTLGSRAIPAWKGPSSATLAQQQRLRFLPPTNCSARQRTGRGPAPEDSVPLHPHGPPTLPHLAIFKPRAGPRHTETGLYPGAT